MFISIVLSIIFLLGNGLFVAAEFSLVASKKDKLITLSATKSRSVSRVLSAIDRLALILSGCQFGITICSIFLGLITEPLINKILLHDLGYSHLSVSIIRIISVLLSLIFVVSCHMLIGEMVPKNIALVDPERVALVLIPFVLFFVRCTKPLLSLYVSTTFFILKIFGIEARKYVEKGFSTQKLSTLIDQSHAAGLIDELEFIRLTRALSSQERTVGELAQSLSEMVVLKGRYYPNGVFGPLASDVETITQKAGFSRYPVVDDDGFVHGYVHVKDLLNSYLYNDEVNYHYDIAFSYRDFLVPVRPMLDFPATSRVDTVVSVLRYNGSHLGKILNDDGTILGIVALEDLVNEFIDTVRDETDRISY